MRYRFAAELRWTNDTMAEHNPRKRALKKLSRTLARKVERDSNGEELGRIASQLLRIEDLIPDCYARWRPIVGSVFRYFANNLSPSRLVPKLEKLLGNLDMTPEQRLLLFLSKMPTLQKLGQVISRNCNLDPDLRQALVSLENSIRDVDPKRVFQIIKKQLGPKITQYEITLETLIHSEASVGAVVRFSFLPLGSDTRREGVFKVLKPDIGAYFWEEISIWDGLIRHFENGEEFELLRDVNLSEIISDIRDHLLPELEFSNEQRNLKTARFEYSDVPNIQIPSLFPDLCTETITAMSYESGVKVTEAFAAHKQSRHQLANCLIQEFIARPLFEKSENASFLHADPHPGNLLVDEQTGNLILMDWALAERIEPEDRHQILLFVSAMLLRDDKLLVNALIKLSTGSTEQKRKLIQEEAQVALLQLPWVGYPSLGDATDLIDRLTLKGIRFKKELLIYRKAILSLQGILDELDPENSLVSVVSNYVGKKYFQEVLQLHIPSLPVSAKDISAFAFSLCWIAPRLQLNLLHRLAG